MRNWVSVPLAMLLGFGGFGAQVAPDSPARPFPQHVAYAPGTIKPARSQDQLDRETIAFYAQWKATYLRQGCGPGRYYVDPQGLGGGGPDDAISISEGHGYGMLIAAFMAGVDPDAKAIFDGMFRFFRDHPTADSPHLMAWKQVRGCANAPEGGNHSATDGDMDIAYALLLAGRQWGSEGDVHYASEALGVIAALKEYVVNPRFFHLMLGDWVKASDLKFYYGTRTSDFMMDHVRTFYEVTGDRAWNSVLEKSYELVDLMQTRYSAATGLLPDFIQDVSAAPKPARAGFLEGPSDGQYGYNACRTPWRIAMDYLLNGEPRAKQAVERINHWFRAKTGDDPGRVYDGYTLSGVKTADYDYNALAFLAPLGVSAMVDEIHQPWLNGIWDLVSSRPLEDEDYYGNTLKLLGMIVMSGNWWNP